MQGRGWVCLKINLVACRGRGWPSRSHSEGLTSHRSYGRTWPRRRGEGDSSSSSSSGPAASIEQKVSRQTWAKDHDGCISHHMLTSSQVWSEINQISLFLRRRQKEPDRGWWVTLLVAKHQRGSPPVAPDQPVHQPLQLEPLPAVPRAAPCKRRWSPGSS